VVEQRAIARQVVDARRIAADEVFDELHDRPDAIPNNEVIRYFASREELCSELGAGEIGQVG
jgi:hypothetical protein